MARQLHFTCSLASNCSNQQKFLSSLAGINRQLDSHLVRFGRSIVGGLGLRMIAGFDNKPHGFVDRNFVGFDRKLGCFVSTGRGSHPHLGQRC